MDNEFQGLLIDCSIFINVLEKSTRWLT